MNESEFRDWSRRAQGNFEERLKALEKKVGAINLAPPRVRSADAHESLEALFSMVREVLAGGGITGLGVCAVGDDGKVRTGWATEAFDRFALAGAASQLWLEIMDRPDREEAEEEAAPAAEAEEVAEAKPA